MFFLYILYSKTIDRFYVGHTAEVGQRLRKHNSNHKGFTGKVPDWKVVYAKAYSTKAIAYQQELAIKKRKSRKYILELIKSSAGLEHPV